MIFRTFFFFLAFSLIGGLSSAATILDSGKYFRTLGSNTVPSKVPIFYSQNGQDIPITILNDQRCGLYDGKGPSPLVFYVIQTGPDGKPIHVPVAQADISRAGNLALLIFSSDPGAVGTYKVQVLPDDLTAFPIGTYEAVNNSLVPVRVFLGGKGVDVPPGETRPIPYDPSTKQVSVEADFYTLEGNVPGLLYANMWGYNPRVRTLILFRPMLNRPKMALLRRLPENIQGLLSKETLPHPPPSTAPHE